MIKKLDNKISCYKNNRSFVSGLKVLAIFGQLKHSRVDNTQTYVLSEELSKDGGTLYKKDVFFNMWISLPSFILSFIPVWLLIKHMDDFKDVEDCDVIVVSGKKMIRFARHIRHYMFPEAKIVQIGNPYCTIRKNDILLRQEGSKFLITCKNTIKINGLLCNKISKEIEEKECKKYDKIPTMIKGPYIGVFIGGKMFSYKLTVKNAINFANIISKISYNMKKPLLILTDKKVGKQVINAIKNNLNCSYYFYETKQQGENPKVAFMSWSDYYIIFGNSINDTSEYIMQEKPTYIYVVKEQTKRYKRFIDKIFNQNDIKVLDENIEILDSFTPSKLNDLDAISKQIKSFLGK